MSDAIYTDAVPVGRPRTHPRGAEPHIGAIQGPWQGSADELLDACRRGLPDVAHLTGELRISATGEVITRKVTPAETFDHLMRWHDEQLEARRTRS